MKTTKPSITRILTITAALAATLAVQLPRSAEASTAGARASARNIFEVLVEQFGLGVRDTFDSGLLRKGQSTVVETHLTAGYEYFFVAGGCEDAYDVDIAVYDENGNLVARDTDSGAVALARVTPRWSGTFHVVITMHDSTWNGAHWVLQTGFINLAE